MAQPRDNLAPRNPFKEVAGNTVEKLDAAPGRNEMGERAGPRQAEEGLWQAAVPPFYSAVHNADHDRRAVFEVARAGQADGRVEPGATNPPASWQHVPQESLDSFALGASGDAGKASPPQFRPRPGSNPKTLSPLAGLQAGERQGQRTVRVMAPENGSRGHRNEAITGGL